MSTKPRWYLTVREVACILGLSTSTVRSYCRRGELTPYTDNGLRILISSRELVDNRRESDERYDGYRNAMGHSGWKSITKDESYTIEYGTMCAVRIGGNEWERWHNPNEDAEPPDEVGAFYSRVVHIVSMSGDEEEAAMANQSTAESLS